MTWILTWISEAQQKLEVRDLVMVLKMVLVLVLVPVPVSVPSSVPVPVAMVLVVTTMAVEAVARKTMSSSRKGRYWLITGRAHTQNIVITSYQCDGTLMINYQNYPHLLFYYKLTIHLDDLDSCWVHLGWMSQAWVIVMTLVIRAALIMVTRVFNIYQ